MRRTEMFIESLFAMRRQGDSIPITYSLRLGAEPEKILQAKQDPKNSLADTQGHNNSTIKSVLEAGFASEEIPRVIARGLSENSARIYGR